eukprot:GHVL01041740.1.p1 GENE.GHVL01041740.1~~GHVL01041740.1.p1  ORF type:complete len:422 (+),score=47.09 GHVL01041740.1:86-1351(+)
MKVKLCIFLVLQLFQELVGMTAVGDSEGRDIQRINKVFETFMNGVDMYRNFYNNPLMLQTAKPYARQLYLSKSTKLPKTEHCITKNEAKNIDWKSNLNAQNFGDIDEAKLIEEMILLRELKDRIDYRNMPAETILIQMANRYSKKWKVTMSSTTTEGSDGFYTAYTGSNQSGDNVLKYYEDSQLSYTLLLFQAANLAYFEKLHTLQIVLPDGCNVANPFAAIRNFFERFGGVMNVIIVHPFNEQVRSNFTKMFDDWSKNELDENGKIEDFDFITQDSLKAYGLNQAIYIEREKIRASEIAKKKEGQIVMTTIDDADVVLPPNCDVLVFAENFSELPSPKFLKKFFPTFQDIKRNNEEKIDIWTAPLLSTGTVFTIKNSVTWEEFKEKVPQGRCVIVYQEKPESLDWANEVFFRDRVVYYYK